MRKSFNLIQCYSSRIRVLCHILFWLLVTGMYYLNYSRLSDGRYIWLFIGKELLVTGSLFYCASWVITRRVAKGKIYSLFLFAIFAYFWWVLWTYITCYLAQPYISMAETRLDRYSNFILDHGISGLFKLDAMAIIILDFVLMVSVPLAPKLMKTVVESSMKKIELERDNLKLTNALLEKSVEVVKLERDNLALELDFLKTQISPHFLFNVLNNIYRMSEVNDPKTSDTVLRLANLVRYILYQAKDQVIILRKEVEFIEDYISLAGIRYGEKVPVKFEFTNVNDPYKIVPLLLIPFVENAFKHGPDRSRVDAWVDIALSIDDDRLSLIVKNSVNHTAEKPIAGGVGLQNVKRRLELHYPDRHQIIIHETEYTYSTELLIYLI